MRGVPKTMKIRNNKQFWIFLVFFIDVSKTIVFYLVEFRCKKWENVYQKKHQKLKRKHKK